MSNLVATSNIVVWIFTSLAIVSVVLRLIARLKLSNNAGIDDLFISWSLLIFIAASILYSYTASKGVGQHFSSLDPQVRVDAARLGAISNAVSAHTFSWPKLSIVALLCRIFNPRRWVAICFYALVTGLIICSFLICLFGFIQCRPASGFWDPEIKAKCWSPHVLSRFGIFCGCYSALLDLLFALYPTPVLWGLNMEKKRKIGLSILMGLGIFAFITAILKAVQLSRLADHGDLTYGWAFIDMWQSVETWSIFQAACLPTLNPLLQFIRENASTITRARYSRSRPNRVTPKGSFIKMNEIPAGYGGW